MTGEKTAPAGLRYSERRLWDRGDSDVQELLGRIARERAAAKALRDAAMAAVARGELSKRVALSEPLDNRTAQARAEAFRHVQGEGWLTSEQHDEAFKVGEMVIAVREAAS